MKPDKPSSPSQDRSPPPADPLTPRPRLLLVLSIVFALWLAFLLAMYFTTVYPNRYIEDRPDSNAGAMALTRA